MTLALGGVLAAAAIFFHVAGLPAQEKSIPDHGSLTDCRMCHAEKYKMWETSGHSEASSHVTPKSGVDCIGCHTAEGFAARLQGNKFDPSGYESFNTISCVVCHKPGSSANPKQLVLDSQKLCSECHTQRRVLDGKEAKGIDGKRSVHSGLRCESCHMPEANHGMKFIRPDDPKLPEGQLDTCARCHKDDNRESRAKLLPDWQASYKKAMDPIQADLAAISAAMKEKPDLLDADLKAKLSDVRANLFILQQDASRGAHNLDFALEIMALASKDIKIIKAAIK
jgi:predicted CXXCH cytochrome family protein